MLRYATVLFMMVICAMNVDDVFAADTEGGIPEWLRTTAVWWGEGLLSDEEFTGMIQWLLDNDILSISQYEEIDPSHDAWYQDGYTAGYETGLQDGYDTNYDDSHKDATVPQDTNTKISDSGDFYASYGHNLNSVYEGDDTAEAWLRNSELLETEIDFLNEYFRLPYNIEIAAEECGEINAFYYNDPPKVVLCYEFVDDLFETLYYFEQDDYDAEYANIYAYDVLNYILYHEIAHLLIDVHELPITGLEENVADQFSALLMTFTTYNDGDYAAGQDILYSVITHYWYEDEYWTFHCPELVENEEDCYPAYWGEHGLDIQRFYNIACYAYGADPSYNEDFIENDWISPERIDTCEYEYDRMYNSWSILLDRYTNDLF